MIQEILNSIDLIDDITTEYTVNTMNSMIDSYEKSAIILENYEGDDLSSFTIFQEGEIMDDVKKQGQGQGTLMKILSFIPRLIKAIFHKIKKAIGKGETPAAVNKELQKAPKEVKKALPILFDNKKDKKSKVSMIKKILIGASTVGAVAAAAVVGKNAMSKSKSDDDSSNAASKMIGLFTKLKNVLKRKSETEKKLEEARKATSKDKVLPLEQDISNYKMEIKEISKEIKENLKPLSEVLNESEVNAVIHNLDEYEEDPEIDKKLSELIATLETAEDKKDAYNKYLDKELSRLIHKYESKHRSLISDYASVVHCCHKVCDKSPVTINPNPKVMLDSLDACVKDLESGKLNILTPSMDTDRGELTLLENINIEVVHTAFELSNIMSDIYLDLLASKKFDDSNTQLRDRVSTIITIMRDLEFNTLIKKKGHKLKIDPSTKRTMPDSHDNFIRNISVTWTMPPDKSLYDDEAFIHKSSFDANEQSFTRIKKIVEEISQDHPEDIKERNIDSLIIFVDTLFELSQHIFTYACGLSALLKNLVDGLVDINKKFEGERNKLFNNKLE